MAARRFDGNFYLKQILQRLIDGGKILVHHRLAALAVSFADGILDRGDRLLSRQHIADGEEAGLHDRVDAAAHASFPRDFISINHMEFQLAGNDLLLDGERQLVPYIIRAKGAVQKKSCAGLSVFQQIEPLQETRTDGRQ